MTLLETLRDALFPGARLSGVTGGSSAESAGTGGGWVRVLRARVPAFDALEPGDLAIVPAGALALVAPDGTAVAALAEACAAASIGGFVLVEGDEPAATEALDRLEQAAADAAIATLRLWRMEVGALERSIAGYLVNAQAELEHEAAGLELRLERLALEGGGPSALVAAISAFLGRAVALEGRRGDALAVHAPPDLAGAAAAVAAYHARPDAVALRVTLPGADGVIGSRAGALTLLGDRPVSDLERVVVERIAGIVALELARDAAVTTAREGRRSESLPSGGPPWVVLLARQRLPGRDDDGGTARADREATRREIRLLAPARRLVLRGDADSLEIRAVVAVDPPEGPDPEGHAIATRLASFLGRTVAVSRPFAAGVERPAAEAEARATLEAAELLPEPPPVARGSRLPVYRLLGSLHSLPDGERLGRALLAPLLQGRADVRREHLATLRALLDHGGVNEAAAALGVHRNTVAYRLRRIEELTGWRLSDPEIRLPLAVALRILPTDQDR